jgi:hypothetical protein
MKLISDESLHELLKRYGISSRHKRQGIINDISILINKELKAPDNSYQQEHDAWPALSVVCKNANMSVTVGPDGTFQLFDYDNERQAHIETKDDVIHILKAKARYKLEILKFNWE